MSTAAAPPGAIAPGRLVFVAGLHRSGTSPLARWLGDHPGVSGLAGTGVPEDEGQHLQSVYPPARAAGGPGRFALRRGMRLTEDDADDVAAQRAELLAAWAPYWDADRALLLEKSPPNLTKTRYLQALFPGAAFVVVVRHPAAVALATEKWARRPRRWWAAHTAVRHWVVAHETLLADAARLERVLLLRYEDLVREAPAQLRRAWEFLGVEPMDADPPVRAGVDEQYFARWEQPGGLLRRALVRLTAMRYERRVNRFGYSLRDPRAAPAPAAAVRSLMAGRTPGAA